MTGTQGISGKIGHKVCDTVRDIRLRPLCQRMKRPTSTNT